ncbi:MAG: ABC transporter permease [Bacteroidia bacterium]
MQLYLKLLKESILFAINALVVNKLRTILSLLGITIGIFAIISVFTMVDSLEYKIRDSISGLGDNVLFIQKWPWAFGADYPWWKYWQRPLPSIQEAEAIKKRSRYAAAVSFQVSTKKNVSYKNISVENVEILAASHDYVEVQNPEIEIGRYFTEIESASGKPIAIIGDNVAKAFFNYGNPLDKKIKIMGFNFEVVGVFKRKGESVFGDSQDNKILIPINFARKIIDLKQENSNPQILVKAKQGISLDELRNELTGIMRSLRKLSPKMEDDFALNEVSLISKGFDELFKIINLAGGIIGFFSILVGGFGIANIMFVSVKERTAIIGIQKSLGAKNAFILFQFLAEAVILCIIGGSIGLTIIFIGTLAVNAFADMGIYLSFKNIFLGIFISALVGLISGIIPAWFASRLNPVDAMRSV